MVENCTGNGHCNNDTFVRITNKDIYNKLMSIEDTLTQQESRIAFSKKLALLSISLSISMILIVVAWAN